MQGYYFQIIWYATPSYRLISGDFSRWSHLEQSICVDQTEKGKEALWCERLFIILISAYSCPMSTLLGGIKNNK